jgi:predicted RNA-binding Zn-ribbon protein involved in translation (DUF1610 family)
MFQVVSTMRQIRTMVDFLSAPVTIEIMMFGKTNVVFACSHCGEAYVCVQERQRIPQVGKFDCTGCNSTVHSWSGPYSYRDWRRLGSRG